MVISKQLQTLRDKLPCNPLATAINRFIDYITVEAGLAPNTVISYSRDLVGFAEHCNGSNITEMSQIRPETIYDYVRTISREGKTESSVNRALVAVKMLLRFGVLIDIIQEDFTTVLEAPKLWQRLPVVCSKEKVMDLLNAPVSEDKYYLRDKTILEMLYATGCRASEVAGLKISNLNLSIGYLRCMGKGSKERIIPLGKTVMAITRQYLEELRPRFIRPASGDYLFLSRTGLPLDRIDIWRLVKKYAMRAGMPANVTVHTLRHCFATHLLSGGADLRTLQEMLGHADIATTQIYTHVDQERLRSIHKKYHPRA